VVAAGATPGQAGYCRQARSDAYAAHISSVIGDTSRIISRFEFLSDDALGLWLCAADAVIANYREILTSGAASLAARMVFLF